MSGIGGLPRDAVLVSAYLSRSCRLQEVLNKLKLSLLFFSNFILLTKTLLANSFYQQ